MSENEIPGGGRIVALVRDLMFASRVRGAAPGAVVAQKAERVLEAVGSETRLVIVELEAAGALELIPDLAGRAPEARVVAFGPHVMEDLLSSARQAGAEVLPRGAFVKRLPELVGEARKAE